MGSERNRRRVKVEGGYLNFSSAHFITYGGKCERLHGHNYGVLVEVEGELGEDKLVFDFTILKRLTKEICQRLDHRFLLPMHIAPGENHSHHWLPTPVAVASSAPTGYPISRTQFCISGVRVSNGILFG